MSNQYVYERKLGQGGFGAVFLVKKKSENKYYVIKEQYGLKSLKIVENEIEQLRKMSHPNIITYYEAWKERDKACIVMEYASGGNLQELLKHRGRPFSEKSAMYIFAQIILGVHHIHKKNVLHRDLKPANIMIHKKNQIKITDFGIAKDISLENAATQIGTKIYMAPEIFKGQTYNHKSDIWSTGIILFELLANKFPFCTKDQVLMMQQIKRGIIRLLDPDTISIPTQKIVYSMLKRAPEERPRAGQLLLHPTVTDSIKKFYQSFRGPEKDLLFSDLFKSN